MTDRIEAIRARHADRLRTRAAKGDGTVQMSTLVDDDMAVLLAILREASAELSIARERAARYAADANHAESRADKAEAQVQRVEALATNWERLAATAMDNEVREWLTAASSSLRAALAPVAPDAEPEPDWRPLSEDVAMHTMAAYVPHNDMRMCGYHSRLGVWTFDNNECLRDHPTMAQIMASAPGDAPC